MLDAGECLVDDVSVVRVSSSQQLIQGGDFSSLANKWRMLGNHGTSAIEPEPGNPGNMVLRVRGAGPLRSTITITSRLPSRRIRRWWMGKVTPSVSARAG